jgi:hypothetical protein
MRKKIRETRAEKNKTNNRKPIQNSMKLKIGSLE